MINIAWANTRIILGLALKGVLLIAIIIVIAATWFCVKLDKLIMYLWNNLQEMIDEAITDKSFGGNYD